MKTEATEDPTAIELHPRLDDTGRTVWWPSEEHSEAEQVLIEADGSITTSIGSAPIATIPVDRMAAAEGHWDRIVNTIRAAEAGETPEHEIEIRPGGELVPVQRGTAGASISKVPEDIMAAPSLATNEIRKFDPTNLENWTYVADPGIPGWRFDLRPVARRFIFYTFASPSHAGQWFLSPLSPNFDQLLGHREHMVTLSIGNERVPVVCRNRQTVGHRYLSEARETAAKFAAYHDLLVSGEAPFSR